MAAPVVAVDLAASALVAVVPREPAVPVLAQRPEQAVPVLVQRPEPAVRAQLPLVLVVPAELALAADSVAVPVALLSRQSF